MMMKETDLRIPKIICTIVLDYDLYLCRKVANFQVHPKKISKVAINGTKITF